jgi:hypothetical protein
MIIFNYVDDLVGAFKEEDRKEFLKTKHKINKKFTITDVGTLHWLLNMIVLRDWVNGYIYLNQNQYFLKLLEKFNININEVKTTKQPTLYDINVLTNESNIKEKILTQNQVNIYQQITGSLLYAAMTTRPDILYAVHMLCKFNAKPTSKHLDAAKHVLRYIAGTATLGLRFAKQANINQNELILTAYTDSDWAKDQSSGKSISGGITMINGNMINWLCRQQQTVALSSAEAEYVALAHITSEVKWIISWFSEFSEITNHVITLILPVTIMIDSTAAIQIASNESHHNKTKHINLRYHFVKDEIYTGNIILKWVDTKEQLADLLTKKLSSAVHINLTNQLLFSPPANMLQQIQKKDQ